MKKLMALVLLLASVLFAQEDRLFAKSVRFYKDKLFLCRLKWPETDRV